MKPSKFILNSAALIVLMVPAAFAQQSGSSSTNTSTTNPPTVQQRKENQQDRIANGIQSGQLTAGETKNLETKESGLNKEESNMRSADSGKLTSADRTKLQNQQNHLSNKIYQDKHNANTAHYGNNQVGQRRENQQDRIANGVRNGSLTAGQTAKLENKEQGVNRTVSGMRQANGGKLTNADKKAVNGQQNKVSKQIYNKKHS